MYNIETKAWKVTEFNGDILALISGVSDSVFEANIGWVLVEDWSEHPRFLLMPERIFKDYYPKLELTLLLVDEHSEPEVQIVEEYPTSIADFDPENIEHTRRTVSAH